MKGMSVLLVCSKRWVVRIGLYRCMIGLYSTHSQTDSQITNTIMRAKPCVQH